MEEGEARKVRNGTDPNATPVVFYGMPKMIYGGTMALGSDGIAYTKEELIRRGYIIKE